MNAAVRPEQPLPAEQFERRHEAAEYERRPDEGNDQGGNRNHLPGLTADDPERDENRRHHVDGAVADHDDQEIERSVAEGKLPLRPPLDEAFVVAQAARALTITVLVHAAIAIAALAAPSGNPVWVLIIPFYAYAAFLAFLPALVDRALAAAGVRRRMEGGIIPFGTIGEVRFALAVLATLMVFAAREPLGGRDLPFLMFSTSSLLCALADSFWIAAVIRRGRCTFPAALRMILREAWNPQSGAWRILTGGRP